MTSSLHTVTHGHGEIALLALHGISADHRMMLPLVEPLFGTDDRVRRYYVDLPGHGLSPAGEVSSAGDVADALDRWVADTLGQTAFLLLGVSFGAMLARELVRRRPGQVHGLALIAPVVEPDPAKRTRPAHAPRVRDEAMLSGLAASDRQDFTSISVIQTAEQYQLFAEHLLPGIRRGDPAALQRIAAHYSLGYPIETGPWDRPTVIVCGRQDSFVGWSDQAELLPHYPNASFAVLDGAGHNVHLERACATQALLTDWLTGARGWSPPVTREQTT